MPFPVMSLSISNNVCRFLGPRMIYTSGVVLNPDIEETLEQLQDNKLAIVCNKLNIKSTDKCVYIFLKISNRLTNSPGFWTLAAVGELSLLTLRRTLDAMPPVLPSLKTRPSSELSVLLKME